MLGIVFFKYQKQQKEYKAFCNIFQNNDVVLVGEVEAPTIRSILGEREIEKAGMHGTTYLLNYLSDSTDSDLNQYFAALQEMGYIEIHETIYEKLMPIFTVEHFSENKQNVLKIAAYQTDNGFQIAIGNLDFVEQSEVA